MPEKSYPDRYHTLTPAIIVRGGAEAIEYYRQAFGATLIEEPHRLPDGKVMHAELKIGDSVFMLSDEFPESGFLSPAGYGGKTAVTLHFYVDDVDAVFDRAIQAGGTVVMPVADQFWGDRFGLLTDPFGHRWGVATHVREVSPDEMREAAQKAMGGGS